MMRPLAVVAYENLLPGTQLINRLQDLGYQVQPLTQITLLVDHARQEKPLVIVIELAFQSAEVMEIIRRLRTDADTKHVIIIAFTVPGNEALKEDAMAAGANVVADSQGILDQIEALLDHALHLE